jgi:hypothetical protein
MPEVGFMPVGGGGTRDLSGVGLLFVFLLLSWSELVTMSRADNSFNKAVLYVHFSMWSLGAIKILPVGRGGEEKMCGGVVSYASGRWWGRSEGASSCSTSSAPINWWPTQDAGEHQLKASTRMRREAFFNLHRMLSQDLATTFHFLPAPSGFVPGAGGEGRGGRSCIVGGDQGPNCFLLYISRVRFAYF